MKKLFILMVSLVLLLGMSVSSFGESSSEDMVLLLDKGVETLVEIVREKNKTIEMQHKTIESLLNNFRSLAEKNRILEDEIRDLQKRVFIFRELSGSKRYRILWHPGPGFRGCPNDATPVFGGVGLYDEAVSMTLVK